MFTDLGETNIDLSQFSGPTNQYSGLYYADIYVNDIITHQNMRIELTTINQETTFCFTQNILDELPLKQRNLKFSKTGNETCPILITDDPDIKIHFLGQNNELHLTFPHKYIENIDISWAPVSARDHGIAGIVFDYSLIASHDRRKYNNHYTRDNTLRSYGTVGININRLRIRGDYQYTRKDSDGHFEWDKIYAFTDIGSLNSKLYVGELYTKSNLFDTFRFKGISLFSDEQMKPSYLRGYAPEITGLASSNAIVTLRQYGSIIRTIQVPSGPFSITDLPSGFSGPVDVTVEEDNGQTQNYQVDIASVPFLTRKGDIRYAANIGKIAPLYKGNHNYGHVLSFDSSIGLTNTFSLIEGVMLTTNGKYQSYNLGLGINLEIFGALSFDVTHSKNSAHDKESFHGERYRVNYSKRFFRYSTLSLSAVHSTDGYTTMQNYIHLKEQLTTRNINRDKNRITLSLSQNIPTISSSISVSISKNSYWGKDSSEYYNASFNKQIRSGYLNGSSVTFSYSRNDTGYYQNKENRFALYVTIPLGKNSRNRLHYNSNYSDLTRQQSHDLTYYNYYNKNNYSDYFTVGTRAYRRPDYSGGNEYSLNASIDNTSRYGRLYATAEYAKDNQRATLGFDSSITLTRHGIATNPRVYNDSARVIIDGGVSGVHIENSTAATNIFGLAGIHNVSAYYPLTYKIDNDNLPQEVEIQNSVFKLAVSDGAIAYRSTNPITGEKAIVKIILANGDYPPFGSMVYQNNNFEREISMVSEEGMTYLSGISKNAQYHLKWGKEQSCQFTIKQNDHESFNNIICQ